MWKVYEYDCKPNSKSILTHNILSVHMQSDKAGRCFAGPAACIVDRKRE